MRSFCHDGLKYHIRGEGQPLLLLHGFGMSPFSYEKVTEKLAKKFEVIVPDYSLSWKNQHGLEAVVRHMRRLLNHLKAGNELLIVGHSLGGLIAALYGAYFPNSVKQLVIVDGLAFPLERNRWTQAALTFTECFLNYFQPQGIPVMGRVTVDFLKRVYLDTGTIYRQWINIMKMDIERYLALIKCPVTILWGEEDDLIPLIHGRLLQSRIKNSQLRIIKGVDHSWPLFHPEILEKFL